MFLGNKDLAQILKSLLHKPDLTRELIVLNNFLCVRDRGVGSYS